MDRALQVTLRWRGAPHPDVAHALFHLARVHRALGRADEAIEAMERAVNELERAGDRDSADLAVMRQSLAVLRKERAGRRRGPGPDADFRT